MDAKKEAGPIVKVLRRPVGGSAGCLDKLPYKAAQIVPDTNGVLQASSQPHIVLLITVYWALFFCFFFTIQYVYYEQLIFAYLVPPFDV